MDGVAAITQRIGEIHALISGVAGTAATSATVASASATTTSTTASFADALSAAGISTLGAAASQLNADGVPLALAGYGNGLIPEDLLSPITGSSQRLWGPAATQLNRLIADAAAAGVTIGVTDGYRSYDAQVAVAEAKGLYSEGGLAAVPGTSQHGWGLAADLDLDAAGLAWMRDHAAAYGFVEAVEREPWHWEFQPAG